MDYKRLPIWREVNKLMVAIEQAVKSFPRYHKYTLGSELRTNAHRLCQVVHRVATRQHNRHKLLQQLVELIDDLKCRIGIAQSLNAFKSFKQFESVTYLVVGLGKQASLIHDWRG